MNQPKILTMTKSTLCLTLVTFLLTPVVAEDNEPTLDAKPPTSSLPQPLSARTPVPNQGRNIPAQPRNQSYSAPPQDSFPGNAVPSLDRVRDKYAESQTNTLNFPRGQRPQPSTPSQQPIYNLAPPQFRPTPATPIKNGKLHAYRLKHVDPKLLTQTLETFLGQNQLRLVPDLNNKVLLTYSTDEVSEQINAIIKELDADPNELSLSTSQANSDPTQSLLLRIFWLADVHSQIEGEEASEILPTAVTKAVEKLGLWKPLLVAQSTTSLAVGHGPREASDFNSSFSAVVNDNVLRLHSQGELAFNGQPQLDLRLMIDSPQSPIELSGNLTAPLGHYMVLGTANHVTSTTTQTDESDGLNEEEEVELSHATSRFAFVVQITEAQSFAPKSSNDESPFDN